MKRLHFTLLSVCAALSVAGREPAGPAMEPASVMGFEVEAAWTTEADLLGGFGGTDLWCSRTTTYEALANGLVLSTEHAKEGRSSGRWADHAWFPTVRTRHVPRDWSASSRLELWTYSEVATKEEIFVCVQSDGKDTLWKDFYVAGFTVDWTGWRKLKLALPDFGTYGTVAGWDQVDGLFFSAKLFDRQPNPCTVLHLDAIALVDGSEDVQAHMPWESEADAGDRRFNPSVLNHPHPETCDGKPVLAPIRYEPYFKAERAVHGYFPRFSPGPVSFDPKGQAYIKSGRTIQWLGEDGHWRSLDLKPLVDAYVEEALGWDNYQFRGDGGFYDEVAIRFDEEGDAYLSFLVARLKSDDSVGGLQSLLLHSRDALQTWDFHQLPHPFVRFEKLDGHNRDCLKRPPVIFMDDSWSSKDRGGYLLIPEKLADCSLRIPEAVKIAEDSITFSAHSGDANFGVTRGDMVFAVFSVEQSKPSKRPPIPEGHPAAELSYTFNKGTVYSRDGTPAYAVAYNMGTGEVSGPVFVGFGGHTIDNHNWPAITIDSKGYLHVVINGHHDPFTYVRSEKPLSIEAWQAPELVAAGTSYATLNCGPDDALYVVTRCSRRGYSFDLGLSRKKPGEPWEEERPLVIPFKRYYKIWKHKMSLDPRTGRLFLSYFAQGGMVCAFKDEYESYIHTWPDRERLFQEREEGDAPRLPLGTALIEPRKYEYYQAPYSEPCVLMSDCEGESWRLAVSGDFRRP